jgi:hypothetical protein
MRVREWVLNVVKRCPQSGTVNALFESGFIQNFQWILRPCGVDLGEFRADHLKSRLGFKHVPVHKTHSAKVIKITTKSRTPFSDPHS